MYHRPFSGFSFIRLAQSFLISTVEGCGARWKETSDASSVSIASDSVDFDAHNIWKPLLELLFDVQIGGIFGLFVEDIDSARIALCRLFFCS